MAVESIALGSLIPSLSTVASGAVIGGAAVGAYGELYKRRGSQSGAAAHPLQRRTCARSGSRRAPIWRA